MQTQSSDWRLDQSKNRRSPTWNAFGGVSTPILIKDMSFAFAIHLNEMLITKIYFKFSINQPLEEIQLSPHNHDRLYTKKANKNNEDLFRKMHFE